MNFPKEPNFPRGAINFTRGCPAPPFWLRLCSGGNDSRKIYEKRLIFKIVTIHLHGLNEQFYFI